MDPDLFLKLKYHNWDAEPDDSRTMIERIHLLKQLRDIEMRDLVIYLKELDPNIGAHILRLLAELKK